MAAFGTAEYDAEMVKAMCLRIKDYTDQWDSESRNSPYSTVADPEGDDWCEACDSQVDYSVGGHGSCGCAS